MPFYSEQKDLTFKYTVVGDYVMEGDTIFEGVSDEVKELIKGLLEVDAKNRLTVEQAIDHPWFTSKAVPRQHANPGEIDFLNFV